MKMCRSHSKRKNTQASMSENILNSFFSLSLVLNLTRRNDWLSGVLFTLEMKDLVFKCVSALRLQSGTPRLWGSAVHSRKMLGAVSAMEGHSFASSGEVLGGLNAQNSI